jgi:hypothetical protein
MPDFDRPMPRINAKVTANSDREPGFQVDNHKEQRIQSHRKRTQPAEILVEREKGAIRQISPVSPVFVKRIRLKQFLRMPQEIQWFQPTITTYDRFPNGKSWE